MSDPTDEPTSQRTVPGPDTAALKRRAFVLGAGATAAGATLGVTPATAREAERSERGGGEDSPDIIAHRGYAGVYPENTVGAVTAASRGGNSDAAVTRGADVIEIDVVPTGDGDVVVFHDSRLAERDGGERGLTDTSGVIWEQPTEVVRDAEVFESGETVPLLTEVMDTIPSSVAVNVEFKNPGSFDLEFAANLEGDDLETQKDVWRPFTQDVLAVVDEYQNDILVSSFYEAALATVRELSELPVAPLLWDSIEDGLDIARTYDAESIHPPYNMIQGTPFYADPYYTEGSEWADIDLLEVAHEEGRDVNVFTLATWYQAEQLASAGVDGLIADYPGLLRFGTG